MFWKSKEDKFEAAMNEFTAALLTLSNSTPDLIYLGFKSIESDPIILTKNDQVSRKICVEALCILIYAIELDIVSTVNESSAQLVRSHLFNSYLPNGLKYLKSTPTEELTVYINSQDLDQSEYIARGQEYGGCGQLMSPDGLDSALGCSTKAICSMVDEFSYPKLTESQSISQDMFALMNVYSVLTANLKATYENDIPQVLIKLLKKMN